MYSNFAILFLCTAFIVFSFVYHVKRKLIKSIILSIIISISLMSILRSNYTEKLRKITIEDNNLIYPDSWLTDKKLSTKRFKNILIISANKDIFLKFACDTDHLMGMEDDEEYNFDYHLHEDFIGTAKDNGFNFLYYHNKENL